MRAIPKLEVATHAIWDAEWSELAVSAHTPRQEYIPIQVNMNNHM